VKAPASGVSALLLLLVAAGAAEAQQLRLRPFVGGLSMPVAIVQDPTDPAVQFTVEQTGFIRVVKNGLPAGDFLDLTGPVLCCGERGLLSLAFPPDAAASGRFYVNFTRKPDGATVVARFRRSADPLRADADSRKDLVWPDGQTFIGQPAPNHNGGHMVFGPDGYLYIGLGDGGGGNDTFLNGQNPASLLGKILRIDVDVPDAHPTGYVVPADNPFVDGLPITALTEIWSFGVRNPWRFNFDDVARGGTGAMVMGDVGQNTWEEIDYEPAGAGGRNYGWRNFEGRHPTPGVPTTPGLAYGPPTDPIHEYPHNGGGASITGGYVYRGSALGAAFQGRYFFADFVLGRLWSIALVVDPVTGEAQAADLREHTAELGGSGAIGNVSSFGVDAAGELFVVSYAGSVFRLDARGAADLVVSSVTAPATGVAGKTLSIPNTVRNVGDQAAAGPIRVDIYMSPDSSTPGAGVLIASRNISVLPAGGVSPVATVAAVPATTAPGLYFVSAVVDPGNTVVEASDTNNGFTAPTRLEIIRPDLVMTTVTGPTRGVTGKPITVGTTVKNTGRLAAGAFTVGIYVSTLDTPGSGQRIALRSVAGLGPGGIIALSTSAILANVSPGTYVLSAVADDGKTVAELGDADDGTNGANNGARAASQILVVPFLPDLEITAVAAPAAMGVARPLTVSFTARNSGPAPAGAFAVSFFLAPVSTPPPPPGEGMLVGAKLLAGLAAGASLPVSASINVPGNLSQNAYYLSAVADVDGLLDEITEGAAANGKVTANPIAVVRPDLRISRFEAGVPPARARAARGGTLAVRNVTVKNNALAPATAGAFTLKFYLSDDDVLDPLDAELVPAPRSPGLPPGASWAVAPTLFIPPTAGTGAKFLIARVDALDEIFEADESNNTLAIPIDVGDFVDLQITTVVGPAAAATGRPMIASFVVRNGGTAPAGPFRVGVFLAPGADPTPGAGVELGFTQIAGLGTGAALANTLVVNVPADLEQGLYSLSAVADPGNLIPEPGGNESAAFNGRVAAKPVSVARPDLRVVSFTAPPRAARGGTLSVTTAVRNAGPAPSVAPASTLKFYLSDDPVLDALDLELAAVRQIPLLTTGAASAGVSTLLIPGNVSPGAKFLIARADALGRVFEGDEGNNTAVLPLDVADLVNLQVTALTAPVTVAAAKSLAVSVTVRNAGTAPAGPFRVVVTLVPPASSADVPIDVLVAEMPGLAVAASRASSAVVSVPSLLAPGLYTLSAVADTDGRIPESNESDNQRTKPITVTP
jgi:glucose/arabinose dehydrogenase/subtilase family serine protease